MMASDSEYTSDDENHVESSKLASGAIKSILDMKADFIKQNKSKTPFNDLKSQLSKVKLSKKRSERLDSRKDIDSYYKEIQSNITNLQNSLEVFHGCFSKIFETMEKQDDRITELEFTKSLHEKRIEELGNHVMSLQSKNKGCNNSYASALQNNNADRINKIEYTASEEERKKNSTDVLLTHPSLNTSENVSENVKIFLERHMKMDSREIDANMTIKKTTRSNTVRLSFSHRRFKTFIYKCNKKLRVENDPITSDLFINDHMTAYNFKILMELKSKRKQYCPENDPFKSIYIHDGRVFIKLKRDQNLNGKHIKLPNDVHDLIRSLPEPRPRTSNDSQPQPSNMEQTILQPQGAASS